MNLKEVNMLHFILIILKIIGIVIAALLGILILLLLSVLFIPIRYRAFGKKEEKKLIAEAKVSWMLKLIFLRVNLVDSDLSIRLRIAGFVFYDNKRPKREKNSKVKNKPKVKKTRGKKIEKKVVETKEITCNLDSNENIKVIERVRETNEEVVEEKVIEEKVIEEKVIEEKVVEEKVVEEKAVKETAVKEKVVEEKVAEEKVVEEVEKEQKKKNPFKRFFLKVKGIIEKVRNLLNKIRSFIIKKSLVKMFLQDENNKAGIKTVFLSLKGVLRHIAPRKVKGSILYGTGDPCSTGQILGIAAVFYGMYGDKIQIIPNFEEEVIEGELLIKGRIRSFTLLIIVIKLIRNRNFRQLLKNAKQLKEEF